MQRAVTFCARGGVRMPRIRMTPGRKCTLAPVALVVPPLVGANLTDIQQPGGYRRRGRITVRG